MSEIGLKFVAHNMPIWKVHIKKDNMEGSLWLLDSMSVILQPFLITNIPSLSFHIYKIEKHKNPIPHIILTNLNLIPFDKI